MRCDDPAAMPRGLQLPDGGAGTSSAAAVPPPPPLPYRDGILGVHCTAAKAEDDLQTLDADYSERMRGSIVSSVQKLFGVSEATDPASVRAVFSKVHIFLGDGAAPCAEVRRVAARFPLQEHSGGAARPSARHADVDRGAAEEARGLQQLLG